MNWIRSRSRNRSRRRSRSRIKRIRMGPTMCAYLFSRFVLQTRTRVVTVYVCMRAVML